MVGGAGTMLKKLSIGLLSTFKNSEKFMITKCLEKVCLLKETDLKEMGLTLRGLG